MGMEQRLHPRERAACRATVSYPPLGLVLGTIRDVSLEGMSIDTSPITLNVNTPVNVLVRRQGRDPDRLSCLHALVVWTKNGRAGLMLRSSDDMTSGVLHELGQDPAGIERGTIAGTSILGEARD